MKSRLRVLIIGLICYFSIQVKAQKNEDFVLNGQFHGLPDRTKLYLCTQEHDTIAETITKGDRFTFRGKLPLTGRFHFIRIDSLVSRVGSKAIFLENKILNVRGTMGLREIELEGSQAQLDYNEFNKKMLAIKEPEDRKIAARNWLALHTESSIAPWLIKGYAEFDFEGMETAYNALNSKIKSSYYGIEARKDLEIIKRSRTIKKGVKIPNFTVKGMDGKLIFIHDIAAKNKFTLIDCWASWCSPCRAEVPELKELFAAYKDKGLNILGVSSDKENAAWEKAVLEDGSTWLHAIENSEIRITKLFDLKAIPAYILIDNQGTLIAFDCAMSSVPNFGGGLRGESLRKKLEELLGPGN